MMRVIIACIMEGPSKLFWRRYACVHAILSFPRFFFPPSMPLTPPQPDFQCFARQLLRTSLSLHTGLRNNNTPWLRESLRQGSTHAIFSFTLQVSLNRRVPFARL